MFPFQVMQIVISNHNTVWVSAGPHQERFTPSQSLILKKNAFCQRNISRNIGKGQWYHNMS